MTTLIVTERRPALISISPSSQSSSPGLTPPTFFLPGRIGSWTVTSLVPSGKVPSTWIIEIRSLTPGNTSSVLSSVEPNEIKSATDRPSRAPSRISSVIKAIASGWFNFSPLAFRFRDNSAAVKIVSRSISVGVSSIYYSFILSIHKQTHFVHLVHH